MAPAKIETPLLACRSKRKCREKPASIWVCLARRLGTFHLSNIGDQAIAIVGQTCAPI